MLFRKDITPRCAYCVNSKPAGNETVICGKKGICADTGSCRKFRYDPLKRVPPKPVLPDFSKYTDEDFLL